MVFNTLTVGAAVTPSVVETYFSHYLNRAPLRHKPTAHISYHEGLRLIREFLDYSSKHTIEDLQAFTTQWVPAPHWVRINDAEIAPQFLQRAASVVQAQLGPRGLELVGGSTWWQWRRPESPLRAEWIEMKKEYHERNRTGAKCQRVMLYVHGGAYYFGSVDEHRYQMQRHARKLRARVLSPRYRLAPQFPFPCGLYDCLATYFYLLEHFRPSQILFAGDSAGAGMVLSMLVTLRDQEQPLPAGTILLSPWVDLTHSFPSVAGDGLGDYIPPHGFHHKPSMAWPPPVSGDGANGQSDSALPSGAVELPATAGLDMSQHRKRRGRSDALDSESDEVRTSSTPQSTTRRPSPTLPRFGDSLSITLDGQRTELREQIQMYTTNELLAHPLVSPVMQPSLGGLPPMLIQTGGAELLKDEQVYLAHKAANPKAYPPNETIMREFDPQREALERWPPTDVQLQLWDDLCHVPHTLSFTRPAKYMYRSVAQFAAWALAHAQKQSINIPNDDAVSFISSGDEEEGDDESSTTENSSQPSTPKLKQQEKPPVSVGKAGDPLPPFREHMIRQRVTRHGVIFPLPPPSEIASLALDPESIGVPKAGPVRKWLAAHQASQQKFASERKKIDKRRAKELAAGYDEIRGENPPPTAIVNRRRKGVAPEEKKKGRSWGLAMWSGWGSSHDEHTLQREQKTEKAAVRKASAASALDVTTSQGDSSSADAGEKRRRASSVGARLGMRWASSREAEREPTLRASTARSPLEQKVVDAGQAGESMPDGESSSISDSERKSRPMSNSVNSPIPVDEELIEGQQAQRNVNDASTALVPTTSMTSPDSERIPGTDNTYLSPSRSRPHNGVQAYPFKLKDASGKDASTLTLDSQVPAAQIASGTSTPHSELMGDAPKPVELPSGLYDMRDKTEEIVDTPVDGGEDSSLPNSTEPGELDSTGAFDSPTQGWIEEFVVPITQVDDYPTEESAVNTIDPPKEQKAPFKLRNQVFDNRTSMLGSIGADGMPNAHYAFLRDDSPQRSPSWDAVNPDATKADEFARTAPFKVRHTIYEPDITLGPSKVIDHSKVPEHSSMFEPDDKKVSGSKWQRESGTLGSQMSDQRIVGEQRDSPPLYISPATNIIIPKQELGRSVVRPSEEDDRPPPPPPKDECYSPASRKITGLRKPKTNGSVDSGQTNWSNGSSGKINTAAPAIGNLSFETNYSDRPQLETFVTASEGFNFKSS